jgi:hypothetical protein
MADVPNATACATCEHAASAHADTADGKNNGGCTMKVGAETCSCSAMSVDSDMAVEGIVTMADGASGTAGSGTAASASPPAPAGVVSDEAKAAAAAVDKALDSALAALGPVSLDGLDPMAVAFIGLVHAADNSSDMLLNKIGVADADADPVKPDDDAGDATMIAEAVDAALSAATEILGRADQGTLPDGVKAAADLVKQAEESSAALLAALAAPDPGVPSGPSAPDKTPPVAPAAPAGDGPPVPAGTAVRGGTGFADAPASDTDAPAAPADSDAPPAADGDGEAVTPVSDPAGSIPFEMPVMVIEGVPTGDGRQIVSGALAWGGLPLPVMVLPKTTYEHQEAVIGGRLDSIERFDASALIDPKTGAAYGAGVTALKATGVFMPAAQSGLDMQALVSGGFLRGVSVDLRDVEVEYVSDDSDDGGLDEDDLLDILMGGMGGTELFTAGRVMGVTVCPFPAFEGAWVQLPDGAATPVTPIVPEVGVKRQAITVHDVFGERECDVCADGAPLVASAGPMEPPADWFDNPQFSGPTPVTITDDGRIFGHLAAWGVCHTAVSGRCVTAPRSRSNYAYYRTKAVLTAEGDLVATGVVTMDTGHASLSLASGPAIEHYDHTGAGVADVAAGEDAYGIWIAGAVRPDVTASQVRTLRGSALSGDWRQNGSGLELVAALAVNVPGFPVVRSRVASGAPTALVAAGGRTVIRDTRAASQSQIADLIKFQSEAAPLLLEFRASRARARLAARRSE